MRPLCAALKPGEWRATRPMSLGWKSAPSVIWSMPCRRLCGQIRHEQSYSSLPVFDKFRNPFYKPCFVDLIRNLCDYYRFLIIFFICLNFDLSPDLDYTLDLSRRLPLFRWYHKLFHLYREIRTGINCISSREVIEGFSISATRVARFPKDCGAVCLLATDCCA